MTQNTGLSLASLPSYWPLIGCYRLNASHGQEYPEQRIASSPVSTHSLGLITIHCQDTQKAYADYNSSICGPCETIVCLCQFSSETKCMLYRVSRLGSRQAEL